MFLNSLMQVTSLPITIYNLPVIKTPLQSTSNKNIIRIVLPFTDQKPADIVKRQLTQVNKKLDIDLQAVFVVRVGLEPGISGSQGKRPHHWATLPHSQTTAPPAASFSVIKECASKFDCLIHEMFYIKESKN